MGLRERFVRWLLRPELERELAKYDVIAMRKEINTLRNEKLHLINQNRRLKAALGQRTGGYE